MPTPTPVESAPSRWGLRLVRLLRLVFFIVFVPAVLAAAILTAWLALGVRASAGSGLAPTPAPSANLDKLRDDMANVRAELKALEGRSTERADQTDKAAREAGQQADAAGAQASDLQMKYTALTQALDKVRADLKTTPATPDGPDLKALRMSLNELKKAQDDQAKQLLSLRAVGKIDERLDGFKKDLDQRLDGFNAERVKDLDGYKKDLDGFKGRLDAVDKRLSLMPQAEPTDVLVLGLHSHNLSLDLYFKILQEVVDPRQRSTPPTCRVGFSLAEGDDYEPIFALQPGDWKKGAEAFDRLGPAQEGSQDRLAGLGTKVQEQFRDSKAAHRRCVVVASASCVPVPSDQFDDWKGLTVQVILIGNDKKTKELPASRLLEWQQFCRHCEGSLTLLSASGDPDAADKDVTAQLKNCLWQATEPVLPLKKKVTP